ncbi:ABC transporter ATP-binding protein [Geomicrobium sediminis]|uniref:ABC-type multidrug transport system fused ATPase/permease subunit n=1 Tax=Geomicrobium sediminis TaxID=1347788 RepID=A0ABS2PC00_9BACL|nr:ABC transporter ATP-binding protein [Geomicrobium sediminis]MBM7632575.1 ABC-type multidrug transport system fused ATPase/permease subunit [Geomicrobium sediminis]
MPTTRVMERFRYSQDTAIEKPFNWEKLARLLHYMKESGSLIVKAIVAMLITTTVRLIVPLIIGQWALDFALANEDYELMLQLAVLALFLYIFSLFANRLRIKWTNEIGQNAIHALRKQLFNHIQGLSNRFFDNRSAGSILVRVVNDVNALQELFTNGIINMLMDIIMLISIVIILFTLSPPLALAVLIVLPIMFFISTKLRRNIRRSWQTVRIRQSKLNSHLNESIQGVRVTQSFSQEENNMSFFRGVNKENYDAWDEASKKSAVFRPFVEMANALGSAVLIWYGAYLVMTGSIGFGVLVSFAFFLGMFWEPISRLGQVYNQLLVAMASSERIFEFLDEEPNVKSKHDGNEATNLKGEIQFEAVTFAYDESRKALNRISLSIPKGQTIALVGHTGSGKSTIANLISRYYDPTDGRIMLDGIDLKDYKLHRLREEVSTVLQDTFIFSGTIRENIRFGKPNATDEEVEQAAKAIGANHFIEKLQNGYETEVEERGNVLSVGERQLLSFARTLLADPKIIILDEATASIDTETEVKIQQALKTLLHGRTSIMIAHRLSTIREADNIIVLEQGNVLENGNHEQLMKREGKYYDLVMSQFKALTV